MVDSVLTQFILGCYQRSGMDWGALYDEMCLSAARRTHDQLGYSELRRMGLALDLDSLDATASLVADTLHAAGVEFSPAWPSPSS